jgi:hypothetical protein
MLHYHSSLYLENKRVGFLVNVKLMFNREALKCMLLFFMTLLLGGACTDLSVLCS